MKKSFMIMLIACICKCASASVLGIFEDTNFPSVVTGNDYSVKRLEVIDNELYAATEKGIYKYDELTNTWSCWELDDVNVIDFKANGNDIVAVIAPQEHQGYRAVDVATMIRFNRDLSEWEDIMDVGMGYIYSGKLLSYVMRLAQHPSKPQILMVAAYPGIWISEDFGASWSLKFELLFAYNMNQFLGWHPLLSDVLFYTSESDMFASQILRSGDKGNNWDIIDPDPSGDNSCHNLAFDPKDSEHILYSGEGCIFESTDCGKTWQCVYREDFRDPDTIIGYAYNIMFNPQKENEIYVVGCDSGNQYIHIFKSADNGKNWERLAKSDLFSDGEYWINESILLNNKIYVYTEKGVLAYKIDNTSEVEDIMINSNNVTEDIYDLSGRKINNPYPGYIYVKTGKKYIAQ